MHVRNKDLWYLWPAKMLDANLGWLWRERYRDCDWPVVRQSVCVLVVDTLNTCCKIMFICIMRFIRTFYKNVSVIWMMIRMVGEWVFLLVPAHPGSPGQRAVKQLLLCMCVTGEELVESMSMMCMLCMLEISIWREFAAAVRPIIHCRPQWDATENSSKL